MPDDIAPLIDRIRFLLDEEAKGLPEELLAEIEHTLTDGYALALALEGESLRIGREIGDRVTRVGEGEPATDLSVLAERLSRAESDVTRLRAFLGRLRGRAEVVRRSASNGSSATQGRSGPHIPRPGYGFRSAAS
jgi:hypothetical protein